MNKIAFRTNAGKEIGYGHVFRCLALAKAMCQESGNIDIVFIINNEAANIIEDNGFKSIVCNDFQADIRILSELSANLIVFDSYRSNNNHLKRIKEFSKLMLFDDNNDIYDSRIPNILLNGNIHAEHLAYAVETDALQLLGMQYLVMNQNYWTHNPIENTKKEGVLITTGGSDTYNIMPQILKALKEMPFVKKVVIGPGFSKQNMDEIYKLKDSYTQIIFKPNGLKDYIETSEYAITASGSTVYEILSQKTVPIIFSIADNQDMIYKCFKDAGVQALGKYPHIAYEDIPEVIRTSSKLDFGGLFDRVDGKGALRVAKEVLRLISMEVI